MLTFVQNFKEKKQVQDYADILFRSPKTLSNLFASCGLPSPLKVIHERIEAGVALAIVMTVGTLSFLVTTPEVWVPDLGSGEHGFPLLSGAGRLVIKDTAILAGAIVVLADSAKGVLNQIKKTV